MMKSDLQTTMISDGEIKHLSGISVKSLSEPFVLTAALLIVACPAILFILVSHAISFCTASTCDSTYSHLSPNLALQFILPGLAIGVAVVAVRWLWLKRTKALRRLYQEIKRFNAVVQAIDISDQLQAAGHTNVGFRDRERLVEALKLTRTDLVRALKTERILRQNKTFIAKNRDIFDDSLAALTALQLDSQASETSHLLNEALEIAVNVQREIRSL